MALKWMMGLLLRLYPPETIRIPNYVCRLPGDKSIYTAELRSVLLVLNHAYHWKDKSFLILSDSLSALQAIRNLKYDLLLVLIKIRELYSQLIQEERKIVFVWVTGYAGIRGNSASYSAAKDALDGDISYQFNPFSDLKPRLNNYIFELWQREWDEYPDFVLHKILPKLTVCLPSLCLTKRGETALSRLHVGYSPAGRPGFLFRVLPPV